MNTLKARRRGFSLIELLVVLAVAVILVMIALPALAPRRHPSIGRQIKDSANIRGIHQGMVLFAQNNKEQYPLPSLLDRADKTIALTPGQPAESKDVTSNILSVLIYGAFCGPEICVSPAETNSAITRDEGFEYAEPSSAADKKLALWDPNFNADFTAPGVKGREGGHTSYAHTLIAGPRLPQWANTFIATQAVFGNRGPMITSVEHTRTETRIAFDKKSNTLAIHGSRSAWEGNIAYNDNHVSYESRPDPETCPRTGADGLSWFDCLFFDEPNDVPDKDGPNNLLVNINRAGPSPADFRTIWD